MTDYNFMLINEVFSWQMIFKFKKWTAKALM